MHKRVISILVIVVVIGIFYMLSDYLRRVKPTTLASDIKNASYLIEGQRVTLKNGIAETDSSPGSASKTITRYFGNELTTDLDGDGRDDVAFILTQERGGSGNFFYAVAALNTANGYVGSDGYLLGDRIAPQSTSLSQNARQKYVVVFNYADRKLGEPMTTQPSVGKSIYLKLDPQTMQWGIVMPDFEGEASSIQKLRNLSISQCVETIPYAIMT